MVEYIQYSVPTSKFGILLKKFFSNAMLNLMPNLVSIKLGAKFSIKYNIVLKLDISK